MNVKGFQTKFLNDPSILALARLALGTAALAAATIPAQRAANVNLT